MASGQGRWAGEARRANDLVAPTAPCAEHAVELHGSRGWPGQALRVADVSLESP
jgi:hypothetical protein